MNSFKEMAAIDCSKHIEKKNGFSYLSWPFAHQMMAERDPDFTWGAMPYGPNQQPYLQTPAGAFVTVTVFFGGKSKSHTYPVLDYRNKPIMEPNAFDVNTSIMRCFVKCCALFGLGLYIYAGEDLPETDKKVTPFTEATMTPTQQKHVHSFVDAINAVLADQELDEVNMGRRLQDLRDQMSEDDIVFQGVWKMFDSKTRSAIKKLLETAKAA